MKNITLTKDEKLAWQYIKETYGLDFLEVGQIVKYKGQLGVVIGAQHQYLLIFIQGQGACPYHPTSNLTYLDSVGEVIKEYS